MKNFGLLNCIIYEAGKTRGEKAGNAPQREIDFRGYEGN